MPVLESTDDKIAPKSIIRHRPIGDSAAPAGKRPVVTTATMPVIQRASRPPSEDDVAEWQRGDEHENAHAPRSETGRATTAARSLPRRLRVGTKRLRKKGTKATQWQPHPLLYLGMGMLTMLLLWVVLSAVVNWATTTLDTLHYGYPRTYQTDAWVGHNEQSSQPSHFIALNLEGRVEVIELPGGDATHARIYLGPQLYGPGNDLVPVTLSFVDVNGDHRPDMLINFQGSRVVFINDGQGFRPLQPSERNQVEQFLQHSGH
jgi:hypothetical protein